MKEQTTLLIDLDNTVMSNPFRTKVFPEICKEFASRVDRLPSEILDLIHQEHKKREQDPKISAVDVMDWDAIVRQVSRQLKTDFEPSVVDLVINYSHPPFIKILDRADIVLSTLKAKNRRRIVGITNGLTKYQLPVLRALDLLRYFDDLLTPDRTGYLKSSKEFYVGYLPDSNLGLKIVVGDDYKYDVFYPKKFGFLSVWVIKESSSPKTTLSEIDPFNKAKMIHIPRGFFVRPDAVISDFSLLPNVIEQIEKASSRREIHL